MYFGEENLIREKIKKFERKPNHLAVILSKNEYSLYCIVKLIAWCEYSGIKYITIYDPYDYIKSNIENQNNDKNFDKTLKGFFKDVSIIYGQNSELNSIKLESKMTIFIVNFIQANNNLIKSIITTKYKETNEKNEKLKSNESQITSSKLPCSLMQVFEKEEISTVEKRKSLKTYEKYYTLKKANYYPDVVLCKNNTNTLALCGFPFSIIESSEFM